LSVELPELRRQWINPPRNEVLTKTPIYPRPGAGSPSNVVIEHGGRGRDDGDAVQNR